MYCINEENLMNRKWFSHGIAAGALIVLIPACSSLSSASDWDVPAEFGENAPSLGGTTWMCKSPSDYTFVQFRSDGKFIVSGSTDNNNWRRTGNSVTCYLYGDGSHYWTIWEGTYDEITQTIWTTVKPSEGQRAQSFTLELYKGVSSTSGNSTAVTSSGSSATTSRTFAVPVWYIAVNGTRASSIMIVTAASKDEAECEAEQQWKTINGWNKNVKFVEAVANW
jgi:hypothetical protein